MNRVQPLVSCIMPTYNRRAFVPHAIHYFLRQEYAQKELIIIDDGTDTIKDLVPDNPSIRYFYLNKKITLGAKLNLACTYATGNIIAHWDDDDWYAPGRLPYQVDALQHPGIEVCGINNLLYYDLNRKNAWQYIYPASQRTWLLGSSLCYTKKRWCNNPFADINVGMDGLFVWGTSPDRVQVLADNRFSVHMIHHNNVSPKNTGGGWWHTYPVSELEKIMQGDWRIYHNQEALITKKNGHEPVIDVPAAVNKPKKFQNVYACLVHESKDCITDLVRNLHYHDPGSVILLYNGSNDAGLLTVDLDFSLFNAVVVPHSIPVKYGYLHAFALHCMAYALQHFSFNTFTIVDSDQLAIRSGYSAYVSGFLSSRSNVGMLSSMPEKVTAGDAKFPVAIQAFREYDLWKPLLHTFPDGESKFVHWTFWPSTVFTSPAVSDLVKLFEENTLLQSIMQQTRIWATEEVIFPTLVRLLGYDIVVNPCSYDYVNYRKTYTSQEITLAMNKPEVYWIHPVERRYDYPLRKYTRQRFNGYIADQTAAKELTLTPDVSAAALIQSIKNISGWLSDLEARLLYDTAKKACENLPPPHHIVEVGSYQGKATVLLGCLIKNLFPGAKITAIDPHDGRLGAEDLGLQAFPPSWEAFTENINSNGLTEVVEAIRSTASGVPWQSPVSLLFIDGLHDYRHVAADFGHFSNWIVPGGYVAFHDYAHYFPGVIAFVDALLDTRQYREVQKEHSLVVLHKA